MKHATKSEAHANPSAHVFVPGVGYIQPSAPLPMPSHPNGGKNCMPTPGSSDESEHLLRKPGCDEAERFFWRSKDSKWAPEKFWLATRLAFDPEHLSRAGWEYVGPAGPREASPVEDTAEPDPAAATNGKTAKPNRKVG